MMKGIRTIIISVMGGTLILIGVALLFLPGPGLLLITGGIGILALEFVWAKRLLKKITGEKRKKD